MFSTMSPKLKGIIFLLMAGIFQARSFQISNTMIRRSPKSKLYNIYDDWRSDGAVDTLYLDEENVQMCLDEFINSNAGMQMFGVHDLPGMAGFQMFLFQKFG